jgi:hypothetical protein
MMIEPYENLVDKVVETLAFYNDTAVNFDIDTDVAREQLYVALGLL